jgi:tetratricopeptide (TPR) repeat protein
MAEIIDEFLSLNASNKALEVCAEMLDYSFVQGCDDIDELRAILGSLQSGQHGRYPHLEETVRNKLVILLPEKEQKKIANMKLQPSTNDADLAKTDLSNWFGGLSVERCTQSIDLVNSTCPVRSSTQIAATEQIEQPNVKPVVEKKLIRKEKMTTKEYFESWAKFKDDNESDNEVASLKTKDVKAAGDMEEAKSRRENDIKELSQRLNELNDTERQFMSEREREKGNEYFKSADNDKALHCYSKSVLLDPSNAKSFANRASVLIRLNRHEEAIKDCTKAFELEPTYTKAIARRGMIFHHLGRYEEAAADFEVCQFLDDSGGYDRLHTKSIDKRREELDKNLHEKTMTRLTIEEIDDDDMEEVYTPGIREMDRTSSFQTLNASTASNNTSVVEASDSDEANVNNDSESFRMRRVEIVEEQSGHDDQPYYASPDESNRYKDEGNKEMKANQLAKAIQLYSKAIDLDPSNSSAYNNRAMAYIKTSKYDKAIADASTCLALDEHNTKALYRRGLAQLMSSKDRESIISAPLDFRAALSFHPPKEQDVILSKKLKECESLLKSSALGSKAETTITGQSNSLAADKPKAKKRSHDTTALCF